MPICHSMPLMDMAAPPLPDVVEGLMALLAAALSRADDAEARLAKARARESAIEAMIAHLLAMFSGHGGPGHEFGDAVGRVTIGQRDECPGEPLVRVDAGELAVLDERGDHRPVVAAFV